MTCFVLERKCLHMHLILHHLGMSTNQVNGLFKVGKLLEEIKDCDLLDQVTIQQLSPITIALKQGGTHTFACL